MDYNELSKLNEVEFDWGDWTRPQQEKAESHQTGFKKRA
jgi:hypothetical protein